MRRVPEGEVSIVLRGFIMIYRVCSALDPDMVNELEFCYLVCACVLAHPTALRVQARAARSSITDLTPR